MAWPGKLSWTLFFPCGSTWSCRTRAALPDISLVGSFSDWGTVAVAYLNRGYGYGRSQTRVGSVLAVAPTGSTIGLDLMPALWNRTCYYESFLCVVN